MQIAVTEAEHAPWTRDSLIIGLVGLAHAISHFFHLMLASLFPWLKTAFALSYAELGLLMTSFFVVSAIGQALSGFVVDKIGARVVLFFGLCCLAAAALFGALAQNYAMLILAAILAGMGNSVFHPADYTILNKKVSVARLPQAFSVHGLTGNLGWAAAPVFLVGIAGYSSWRSALFAAAALPVLVLALLWCYRDLFDTRETQSGKPGTATQPSSGHALDFLKLRSVWLCFLFFFWLAMALGGVQSFAPAALREIYGMSLSLSTTAYTSYMVAAAAGMWYGGLLAARKQHDYIVAVTMIAAAIAALSLASGLLLAQLALVGMVLVGFAAGVAGPSRDLLIRAAAPKNATGRVYGMVYSGLDSGMALAPLLFGLLMDNHMPRLIFVGIALFQLCAMLTALAVGHRNRHA